MAKSYSCQPIRTTLPSGGKNCDIMSIESDFASCIKNETVTHMCILEFGHDIPCGREVVRELGGA